MTTSFVVWSIVASLGVIAGFLQICASIHFHSICSLLAIKKRYPKIIILESIAVIVFMLIIRPLFTNHNFQAFEIGNSVISFILFLFAPPFIFFILDMEIARLWLISYNLHYLNASKNEKWKSLIDQNIVNKNWYIRNKQKYGNPKTVLTVAIAHWLFVSIIVDMAYCVDWRIFGTLSNSFFYLTSLCFLYFIYYKCRNYKQLKDNLLFFYEFKATIVIWSISLAVYLVAEMVNIFGGPLLVKATIYSFVSLFSLSAPSLLSTAWIPYKLAASHRRNNSLLKSEAHMKTMESVELSSSKCSENGNKQKVFEILKDQKQFERFIQFMFRDFSSEAMLGYIEMVQFKERFVGEMEINENIVCPYMNLLYVNVPKSSIVYGVDSNKNGIEKMKVIASKLCEKYIHAGSEYEVNIAWRLRTKIVSLNDSDWNLDLKNFVSIFDEVLDDLFRFMRQSFERFDCEFYNI